MPGFLTPYKGERYHLSLFRGRRRLPTKEEEWFNYHHSSLRNVIERYFGALKARFPILKQMPKGFSVQTQKYLPTACCTVHNFIRMHDKNDAVFKFYNKEDLIVEKLPVSGCVMKGVTVMNFRMFAADNSEVATVMVDAFAEEHGVFLEAVVQILEKHISTLSNQRQLQRFRNYSSHRPS
ncbi:hypothetical protein RHSIM_Rhsim10G0071400 [Rhododendron simsii]|uniref:DDE Tnp4 domain-containing protein n=1 Tax=Rhododendron simsii TaxID=118357 RepID=A0A834LDL5_RHOSS|nr:hypothetical protein RHSIM_Rhsim10G0071400 [Rhododendron simsii]